MYSTNMVYFDCSPGIQNLDAIYIVCRKKKDFFLAIWYFLQPPPPLFVQKPTLKKITLP